MPVRPPRLASIAITTHWAPNWSASSVSSSGRASAAELTETLSAPASSTAWASATERIPPPIVNGMKTLSAVRRASSTIVSRFSCEAVMSRKIELVGALGVVALGQLDRVARVAQADEVGALDDAPGVDVQAGDDSSSAA